MKRRNVLFIIALMVIGFAAVSTTLILNGTLNVGFNNQDFDVYFSNAIVNGKENKSVIKEDRKIEFTADMSLLNEKYELEYFITNGSKNYDAELNINCTAPNEYLTITNDFVNGTILEATKTTSGNKLTVTVEKVYAGEDEETKDFEVTCEIVATPKERDSLGTGTPADNVEKCTLENPTILTYDKWTLTDNDCSGDLTKDDLITLNTESFYVYDIEGDKVSALAQYNLLVEGGTNVSNPTGLQSPDAIGYGTDPMIGGIAYNSNYPEGENEYEVSTIKNYVEAYATTLSEIDTNIQTVRLITKEELDKAGCDTDNKTCELAPSYIYSTSYWTSTFDLYERDLALDVYSNGTCERDGVRHNIYFGVRPVIEVSKSLFE